MTLCTDTHIMGSVNTANAKHSDTAMVNAIHQMHAHKDKKEVHNVLCATGLHGDFTSDNGVLTHYLKWLVEQGNSVHTG